MKLFIQFLEIWKKEINDEDINLFLDNFFNFICKGLDPPLNEDIQIKNKLEK